MSAARGFCQSNGGDLCSILDEEEQAIVDSWRLNQGGFYGTVWIGLWQNTTTQQWYWVDGSPVTYLNWDQGEGHPGDSEEVTAMYTNGEWDTWGYFDSTQHEHHVCCLRVVEP